MTRRCRKVSCLFIYSKGAPAPATRGLYCSEAVVQIGDDVVDVLGAD